jgi:pyoverdine/dityrosine biosynthesis protein Dit1/AcrR family transcriptional regulator
METIKATDRRTRQRVLEAALTLLSERGLSGDLLQDAATRAGVPLDRAQVFFKRDEDLVLALYARLAAELEARVPELPEGNTADRFRKIMFAKLAIVAPHRQALAALLAALLDPRHELGVLSQQTQVIRNRVMGVISAVVLGASDRRKTDTLGLTRTLYGLHLALMLLWTQDQTPEASATRAAIDLICDLVSLSGRLSWLPNFKHSLARLDEVAAPLVEPAPDPAQTELSIKILRRLFQKRRLESGAGPCAANPCEQCLALHLPKVRSFVSAGEPIHFLLPAFPAKSPSPRKVLGRLPDMAEELALGFLERACEEIKDLYAPGARITICSDGRVFSDLVGVSDYDVTAYGKEISGLLARLGVQSLDLFSMEDLFEMDDHGAMREQLRLHYADALGSIEERVRCYQHHQMLFNGIQRFLFEDRIACETEKSRTQVRKECKERTYLVIQRSDAWSRLLSDCFPAALRLSIHPQNPHSEKIGILLGDADDAWLTPWHGVAVRREGQFTLMRRHEAEALGAQIVEREGRPSYYQVEAQTGVAA